MTVTSIGAAYEVVIPKRATYARQFTLGNRADQGDAGALPAGDGRTWYVPVDLDDVDEVTWLLYPNAGEATETIYTADTATGTIAVTTAASGLITVTIPLEDVDDLPLVPDGRHVLQLEYPSGAVLPYLFGDLRVVPEGTAV